MRTSLALAIYVSFNAGAFASAMEPDWSVAHSSGMAAVDRRNYEEAIEFFGQSWSLSTTAGQKGISANELGQTYRLMGKPNEARMWLERAYETLRADARPGRHFATVASSLGDLYRDAGEYPRAELVLREALTPMFSDPDAAALVRNSFADVLREEGRWDEARQFYLESLHHGISWVERVNALSGLAEIDAQKGDREAAVKNWNEVAAIARAQKDDNAQAVGLSGLGTMWLNNGDVARAEPLFRRALAIVRNNPSSPPQQTAAALSGMATVYRAQNKLALAEDAWTEALELQRAANGDSHPQVAWLKEMLADVYAARGERDRARSYATQALDSIQRSFGDDALPTAVAFANRAQVEQRILELDAAAGDYDRALAIARAHPGHASIEKTIIDRYAVLLKAMHRNREANALNTLARSFHN